MPNSQRGDSAGRVCGTPLLGRSSTFQAPPAGEDMCKYNVGRVRLHATRKAGAIALRTKNRFICIIDECSVIAMKKIAVKDLVPGITKKYKDCDVELTVHEDDPIIFIQSKKRLNNRNRDALFEADVTLKSYDETRQFSGSVWRRVVFSYDKGRKGIEREITDIEQVEGVTDAREYLKMLREYPFSNILVHDGIGLLECYDVAVPMGHTFGSVISAISKSSKKTKVCADTIANKIEKLGGKILLKEG